MANPSTPYFGIWRLFIDESRTKINDFYEIDDINTFGASAFDQITGRYMQKMGITGTSPLYTIQPKCGFCSLIFNFG